MMNRRSISHHFFNWFIFLFLLTATLRGETPSDSTITQIPDSTKYWRDFYDSRPAWEKFVSLPGKVISLPLVGLLKGVEWSLIWMEDTGIAQWALDLLTVKIPTKGIEPLVSRREGIGLRYYDNTLFRNRTQISLSTQAWVVDARQRHVFEYRGYPMPGKKLESAISLMYSQVTIEYFFGIGPKSKMADRSSFTREQAEIKYRIGKAINPNTLFFISCGTDFNNILRGRDRDWPSLTDLFSKATLPGLDNRLRFRHIGFSLLYDSRNRQGLTTAGWNASFKGEIYDQIGGDQFRFYKFYADAQRFFHLLHDRALVLRLAGETTDPVTSYGIPFFYLSSLGRRETIRGHKQGRFRDRDMLLASLEYRYPFWRTVAALWFVDVGTVSPNIFKRRFYRYPAFGFGGGFRFQSSEHLIFKLEFGASKGEFRLYFTVNE